MTAESVMQPASVANARSQTFALEWALSPTIPVAVNGREELKTVLRKNLPGADVKLKRVGRRRETSAVVAFSEPVYRRETDVSLWVRSEFSSYKLAYLEFLTQEYGIQAPQLDGYDVDHLLNRKRSDLKGLWLRVEACPSDVNQAWGRTFERWASAAPSYANEHRPRRTACWGIAAKNAGLTAPNGIADAAGIQSIVSYFETQLPKEARFCGLAPGPSIRRYFAGIYP